MDPINWTPDVSQEEQASREGHKLAGPSFAEDFLFLEVFSYTVFEAPQILELERGKKKEATNHHVGKGVLN